MFKQAIIQKNKPSIVLCTVLVFCWSEKVQVETWGVRVESWEMHVENIKTSVEIERVSVRGKKASVENIENVSSSY
ncbi:hypothetical protein [Planococcus shixiaomingii]|uniref:hypothetical protein n=1 Tax=Planococcus shixiaomingii TaxID=3058393 RepID=UPI00265A1047|nr:hypothetical protein [Planococcus sp. N028]